MDEAPEAVATPTRARFGARGGLAVANVVILVTGIVSSFIVGGPSDTARATTALREARAFSRHAKTVHFSSQARYEFAPPNQGFTGTSYNVRVDGDGEIEFPDRFRILEHQDGGVGETIVVGKNVFHREGDDATNLLSQKWVDLGALLQRNGAQGLGGSASSATGLETLPAVLRPSALLQVIRATSTPHFLRRKAHVTRVRAPIGLGQLHSETQNINAADTELWVRDDGTIDRVTIRFRGRALRGTVTYDFRLWRRPVVIAAPTGGQLDTTPGINEEQIAAFKDAPLLQPRGIPAGWILEGAAVLAPEETEEGCAQVEVDYTDPKNEDKGYLSLYEFPVSCLKSGPPTDATPFTAGAAHGWIQDVDNERHVQIQVGSTVVQVETDLTAADLAIILLNFTALDLSHLPAPLAQISSPHPTQ